MRSDRGERRPCYRGLVPRVSFCHCHQVGRHPLLDNLVLGTCDTLCPVPPILGRVILAAGLFRIVLDLLETDYDALSYLIPVLELIPLSTIGKPADQSSSGVMLSYSGIVRKAGSGNAPPPNSLTICDRKSFIVPEGFDVRMSSARRKMSETVGLSAIFVFARRNDRLPFKPITANFCIDVKHHKQLVFSYG
jgi:hypothetical protein